MPWVTKPSLNDGESIAIEFAANRTQGWRAVGGKVWLTSSRVLFVPNAVDTSTGGKGFECGRGAVSGVDVAPATLAGVPFSGGLRRRLRLRLLDGSEELFVVDGADALCARIVTELGLGGR